MFGSFTYIGYTLLFCIPALLLMWLRQEFFPILVQRLRAILLITTLLTLYGSLIWPIAIKYGAWRYDPDKITGIKLLNFVYLDDVLWWLLVSLVLASFITLSRHYADRNIDVFWRELTAVLASFKYAFQGFRAVAMERNLSIHVAAAAFVILEGILFKISTLEWFIVIILIGGVFGFEFMNTAIERLATKMSRENDEDIRFIKDVAAAGVLIFAFGALVIGFKIFLSKFIASVF